jgi:hypothetical protein
MKRKSPKTVVRLAITKMKLREISDWNFPAAHYLESWGDANDERWNACSHSAVDSAAVWRIDELEFLARIAGESQTNPTKLFAATLAVEGDWKKFLFNGFLAVPRHSRLAANSAWLSSEPAAKGPRLPATASKSFSTAMQKWTTVVTRTTAGCRNCPIPSRR